MKTFMADAQVRRHPKKPSVDVLVAKHTGAPQVITMDYCPFCGTRIVMSILHKLGASAA